MPKVALVLGRRTIGVYDLDQSTIRIGRSEDMDIPIDNVSVSREHAQIVRSELGWTLKDLGSANGTFVNGERVEGTYPLRRGDEISIGKFSLFFDKVVGEAPAAAAKPQAPVSATGAASGTMYIRPSDVKELLRSAAEKRQAHLSWKAGGREGTHALTETSAVLVGTDELCDLRVPTGPRHHILVSRGEAGFEVRNLSLWGRMRVNGSVTRRARLSDGNVIALGGLELRFVDRLG